MGGQEGPARRKQYCLYVGVTKSLFFKKKKNTTRVGKFQWRRWRKQERRAAVLEGLGMGGEVRLPSGHLCGRLGANHGNSDTEPGSAPL